MCVNCENISTLKHLQAPLRFSFTLYVFFERWPAKFVWFRPSRVDTRQLNVLHKTQSTAPKSIGHFRSKHKRSSSDPNYRSTWRRVLLWGFWPAVAPLPAGQWLTSVLFDLAGVLRGRFSKWKRSRDSILPLAQLASGPHVPHGDVQSSLAAGSDCLHHR